MNIEIGTTWIEFHCDCNIRTKFIIAKSAIPRNGLEKECKCGKKFIVKEAYDIKETN